MQPVLIFYQLSHGQDPDWILGDCVGIALPTFLLGLVGGYSIITTVCIGRISHEPGQARSPDIVRQEVEVRAQEARRESPGLGGQAGKSWPRQPGGKVLA